MESGNRIDELVRRQFRYIPLKLVNICKCGAIPEFVDGQGYRLVLECRSCGEQVEGGYRK